VAIFPVFVWEGLPVPKTFQEAFEEWRDDTRYQIGEDIGHETPCDDDTRPTRETSSLTPEHNGNSDSE